MNLFKHSQASENLREAKRYAAGIAENIDSVIAGNAGPKTIEATEAWLEHLGAILGYSVIKESK